MSYYDRHPFEEAQWRWNYLDSTPSFTSILIAVVAGAYVLVSALELSGFPLRLRLQQLLQRIMSVFSRAGTSSDTESSEDTMQRGGGILSSVFGLNSGSLLQKGVRGLADALTSCPSTVPPGLGNISNSCYQNSVMQGLASLPSLQEYLFKTISEHPSFTADTTNGALYDMISKLNDPKNQGQNFWIRGKLKSMSTFQQQDAQEYYSKILDEMDKEMEKAASSRRRSSVSWAEAAKELDKSVEAADKVLGEQNEVEEKKRLAVELAKLPPNPLDGLIAQRVGCTSCGYSEGLSLISFNCITVSLGNNYGYDIRECLDEYTRLEYIDGVECSKCTLLKLQKTLAPIAAAKPDSDYAKKLKTVSEMIDDEKFDDNALVKTLNIPKKNWVQSSKSKQIVVARAPKLLVLHINRSIFDEMTGAQYKNTAGVSYPSVLDLGNWCLGNSPSGSRQPDISLEEWPRDPRQSMLPDHADEAMTTSPFQYRLRAAVTHYGSHGNGHYVCYRPVPRMAKPVEPKDENNEEEQQDLDEQWWRFSDDSVCAVSEEQAHQGNVFMLFYERIDGNTAPKPDHDQDGTSETFSIPEDAPLPPAKFTPMPESSFDANAADVPIPEEGGDTSDLIPPSSPALQPTSLLTEPTKPPPSSAYPTPPPESIPTNFNLPPEEAETSEAESEDTTSTQLPLGSELELSSHLPQYNPFTPISPQMMRTAGNAAATARGRGTRQSLPLVSAS